MKISIKAGTTSKLLDVFIQDSSSTTGAGLTGLAYNTASLTAYYYREGAASATAITLATMTLGTWATGGFIVVDGTNMPGCYQLGIPDAAIASGAKSVLVMLKGATNMAPLVLEVELTATDNQDAVRGGMTALPNAAANAAGGLIISTAGALDADAQRSDVAAILVDTGTTLDGRIPAALTADGNIKADTLRVSGTAQTAADLAAMLTTIDNFLDTEIASILGDTGTDIPALIAALNNLSAAQVNAEVVDALNVDTYAQPGQGAPAATTTMRLMLAYLYKFARNKRDNDGSVTNFYNDDASTVDHKQSTAESGGTVTVGEMATGP